MCRVTQAANLDHNNDGVPNRIEHFIGSTTGFTALPTINTVGGLSIT